jgi:cell division protein FtsN
MVTQMPTPRRTIRPTSSPILLKTVTQQASPTQRPNTEIPTINPSIQPTFTPSFRPSPIPSLAPSQEVIKTLSPTASGVGVSSINSASTSERNGITNTAIGVGVGCIVILLIIVCACIFVTKKKSKEKLSPYQVWTDYYAGKPQEKQINSKEDIHHFYSKSPRPSFNQNTVFTPHVSGRISSRNSQILSPVGTQKNMQRLSFSRGPALHNNF